MVIDWSVNVSQIITTAITLLTVGGGAVVLVVTLKNRVDALTGRMSIMEEGMKDLIKVLVEQGRHEERLTAMDNRITTYAQRLDDAVKKLDRFFEAQPVTKR